MPGPSATSCRVLIKPSHCEDEGYAIRWLRSAMPSNSLAALYGPRRGTAPSAACWARSSGSPSRPPTGRTRASAPSAPPHGSDAPAATVWWRGSGSSPTGSRGRWTSPVRFAHSVCRWPSEASMCRARSRCSPGCSRSSRRRSISGSRCSRERPRADSRGFCAMPSPASFSWCTTSWTSAGARQRPHADAPDGPGASYRRRARQLRCGRGCPFQCSFCTIIKVQGRPSRSPDDVETIVRANLPQGITSFSITDDNGCGSSHGSTRGR